MQNMDQLMIRYTSIDYNVYTQERCADGTPCLILQ